MDLDDETAVPEDLVWEPADNVDTEMDDVAAADADEPQAAPEATSRRVSGISLNQLTSYFAPCGRCGYFLVGYRAALGLANLQTAVDRAKSGWIVLTWNDVVRELVMKSYASSIEENDFHFEGCCPECRRHFIFRASRRPNHPHSLRIEMKPRKRQ